MFLTKKAAEEKMNGMTAEQKAQMVIDHYKKGEGRAINKAVDIWHHARMFDCLNAVKQILVPDTEWADEDDMMDDFALALS